MTNGETTFVRRQPPARARRIGETAVQAQEAREAQEVQEVEVREEVVTELAQRIRERTLFPSVLSKSELVANFGDLIPGLAELPLEQARTLVINLEDEGIPFLPPLSEQERERRLRLRNVEFERRDPFSKTGRPVGLGGAPDVPAEATFTPRPGAQNPEMAAAQLRAQTEQPSIQRQGPQQLEFQAGGVRAAQAGLPTDVREAQFVRTGFEFQTEIPTDSNQFVRPATTLEDVKETVAREGPITGVIAAETDFTKTAKFEFERKRKPAVSSFFEVSKKIPESILGISEKVQTRATDIAFGVAGKLFPEQIKELEEAGQLEAAKAETLAAAKQQIVETSPGGRLQAELVKGGALALPSIPVSVATLALSPGQALEATAQQAKADPTGFAFQALGGAAVVGTTAAFVKGALVRADLPEPQFTAEATRTLTLEGQPGQPSQSFTLQRGVVTIGDKQIRVGGIAETRTIQVGDIPTGKVSLGETFGTGIVEKTRVFRGPTLDISDFGARTIGVTKTTPNQITFQQITLSGPKTDFGFTGQFLTRGGGRVETIITDPTTGVKEITGTAVSGTIGERTLGVTGTDFTQTIIPKDFFKNLGKGTAGPVKTAPSPTMSTTDLLQTQLEQQALKSVIAAETAPAAAKVTTIGAFLDAVRTPFTEEQKTELTEFARKEIAKVTTEIKGVDVPPPPVKFTPAQVKSLQEFQKRTVQIEKAAAAPRVPVPPIKLTKEQQESLFQFQKRSEQIRKSFIGRAGVKPVELTPAQRASLQEFAQRTADIERARKRETRVPPIQLTKAQIASLKQFRKRGEEISKAVTGKRKAVPALAISPAQKKSLAQFAERTAQIEKAKKKRKKVKPLQLTLPEAKSLITFAVRTAAIDERLRRGITEEQKPVRITSFKFKPRSQQLLKSETKPFKPTSKIVKAELPTRKPTLSEAIQPRLGLTGRRDLTGLFLPEKEVFTASLGKTRRRIRRDIDKDIGKASKRGLGSRIGGKRGIGKGEDIGRVPARKPSQFRGQFRGITSKPAQAVRQKQVQRQTTTTATGLPTPIPTPSAFIKTPVPVIPIFVRRPGRKKKKRRRPDFGFGKGFKVNIFERPEQTLSRILQKDIKPKKRRRKII